MNLPSGYEISKEDLVELCEAIIGEKFMMECPYDEAFGPTAESLSEGEYVGIPALSQADVAFLYDALRDVIIGCETALRSTLGAFMASNVTVNSW